MATCPRCRAQMSSYDAVCPSCGYDFPLDDPNIEPILPKTSPSGGMAFGAFGDLVLAIGSVICLFGVAVGAILLFLSTVSNSWPAVAGALGFTFYNLLSYVIIQRLLHK